jgi:Mg2+/Co2+ transporter CorC
MEHPRVFLHLPADHTPDPKVIITRGECDIEDKTIYINPKQSDKQKLITAIHESLHYIFPKHTEHKVELDCILIGEVILKLGYRSKKKYVKNKSNHKDT